MASATPTTRQKIRRNIPTHETIVVACDESPQAVLSLYAEGGWRLISVTPGMFDAQGVFRAVGFSLYFERPFEPNEERCRAVGGPRPLLAPKRDDEPCDDES